jgi:hypothetical protein
MQGSHFGRFAASPGLPLFGGILEGNKRPQREPEVTEGNKRPRTGNAFGDTAASGRELRESGKHRTEVTEVTKGEESEDTGIGFNDTVASG